MALTHEIVNLLKVTTFGNFDDNNLKRVTETFALQLSSVIKPVIADNVIVLTEK